MRFSSCNRQSNVITRIIFNDILQWIGVAIILLVFFFSNGKDDAAGTVGTTGTHVGCKA
jgi:hypothetical protein